MPNEVVCVLFLKDKTEYSRHLMGVTEFIDYNRPDKLRRRLDVRYEACCQLDMRDEVDTIKRFYRDVHEWRVDLYGTLTVVSPMGKFIDTNLGKAIWYMRNDDIENKALTLVIGFDGKEYNSAATGNY